MKKREADIILTYARNWANSCESAVYSQVSGHSLQTMQEREKFADDRRQVLCDYLESLIVEEDG